MGKSQAAALVLAGLVAGATGSQFIVSATKGSMQIDVQYIKSRSAHLPDGGSQVQVETCGIVNKHDGTSPQRWCDYRVDKNMDALVAVAVDRVAEAASQGEKRQADAKVQLDTIRKKQAADAEKRKQERGAARDGGHPSVPGPTP